MKKIALITGATSGIGKAIAQKMAAENKYDLILTGRRAERLKELKRDLEKNGTKVKTLSFDICNQKDVFKAIQSLPEDWCSIDILVNNAGLASGLDPIDLGNIEDWEKMIDTNIKGLLYVTRSIVPLMKKKGRGHIINIGSIAGKEVYANGNVYCATKHAVDALTKAMRIDLLSSGIKVSQVCPGAVETEFSVVRFHQDADRAATVYKGYEPLKGDDIATCVLFILSLPQHVNINDMVVMPTAQANSSNFYKKL
ncbi:SDR family NAD(P)-dependent oxidoreductase [Porphyromonas pogonae]|uniref:SDR family NAD(P)-dependent oxidoreductase n=1 Tax=Porphyromonas pogonae TaxID=867595 RepID=UPI002E776846|nr:SDR family NAD(P)-dependent oxidoreductase [Porphyromonas pogonae]